ncbi:hypothetical protein [Legionella spiritensis]|nr:hypothetical protein [Legionella spiritensis]
MMSNKQKVNTEQYLVIKNLNNYMKSHNLPITLDKGGICHALSTLYIKYVLDGKEKEFEELLAYIAQKIPIPGKQYLDEKLFILIEKIIALQVSNDHSTRNKYTQSNSHEQLDVKGKNLQSIFKVGLQTSHENWAKIMQDIDLQANEVMRVSTLEHTIAIARDENGTYKVYDPNNTRVCQKFDDASQMTKWLSKNAFNFSLLPFGSKTLDMNIDVISTESPIARRFPDKNKLFDDYLTPSQRELTNNKGGGLHFAMTFDDAEAVEYILKDKKFNRGEFVHTALCGIARDSENALAILINNRDKKEHLGDLQAILLHAISSGKYRCMQKLLEIEEVKAFYHDYIKDHPTKMLRMAFSGMNEQSIDKVFNDFITHYDSANNLTKTAVSTLIDISISKKNPVAITILAGKINYFDKKITDHAQRLTFIKQAIEHNDPLMVRTLIKNLNLSSDELNCLNIGVSMVNKYNVEIFTTLKEKGFQFSPQADDLIERKQQQSIGVVKSIGLALTRFSEFLTQQNKIKVDHDKIKQNFTLFKERNSTLRNEGIGPAEPGKSMVPG